MFNVALIGTNAEKRPVSSKLGAQMLIITGLPNLAEGQALAFDGIQELDQHKVHLAVGMMGHEYTPKTLDALAKIGFSLVKIPKVTEQPKLEPKFELKALKMHEFIQIDPKDERPKHPFAKFLPKRKRFT